MPYWSSSRVGVVPQGDQSSSSAAKTSKKRSERFGRRKGITMEVSNGDATH